MLVDSLVVLYEDLTMLEQRGYYVLVAVEVVFEQRTEFVLVGLDQRTSWIVVEECDQLVLLGAVG